MIQQQNSIPQLKKALNFRIQQMIQKSDQFIKNNIQFFNHEMLIQYTQKQHQTIILTKLVMNIIDLLIQQVKQKNPEQKNNEQDIQDLKQEINYHKLITKHYQNIIEQYKQKLKCIDYRLTQINNNDQREQNRNNQQTIQKQNLNRINISQVKKQNTQVKILNRFSNTTPEKIIQDQNKLHVIILEYQLNQIKKQLQIKQLNLCQKQGIIKKLTQKLLNSQSKFCHIQNTFKQLKQNYNMAISQNQYQRQYIDELEQKLNKMSSRINKNLENKQQIIFNILHQDYKKNNQLDIQNTSHQSQSIPSNKSDHSKMFLQLNHNNLNIDTSLNFLDANQAQQQTKCQNIVELPQKKQKQSSESKSLIQLISKSFNNLSYYTIKKRIKKK